jgi:hypothetical protein
MMFTAVGKNLEKLLAGFPDPQKFLEILLAQRREEKEKRQRRIEKRIFIVRWRGPDMVFKGRLRRSSSTAVQKIAQRQKRMARSVMTPIKQGTPGAL